MSLYSDPLTSHLYLFPALLHMIGRFPLCPVDLFFPLFHQTRNVLNEKWKVGPGQQPGSGPRAGFPERVALRTSFQGGGCGEPQRLPLRYKVGGMHGRDFPCSTK